MCMCQHNFTSFVFVFFFFCCCAAFVLHSLYTLAEMENDLKQLTYICNAVSVTSDKICWKVCTHTHTHTKDTLQTWIHILYMENDVSTVIDIKTLFFSMIAHLSFSWLKVSKRFADEWHSGVLLLLLLLLLIFFSAQTVPMRKFRRNICCINAIEYAQC